MLRASLLRSRHVYAGAVGSRSGAQWLAAPRVPMPVVSQRYFADVKKPDETVLPGSQSAEAPGTIPPPGLGSTSSSTIPAKDVPRVPPSPSTIIPPTGTGTASVAPPAAKPLPPPPKRKRRFRRFLLYLLTLTALGYGGGVYYSLISDNFHDFFVEFVPFGEDVVGYFEEREFKKRFQNQPGLLQPGKGDKKITIPKHSGASWKVAEDENRISVDLGSKNGRHLSAVEENKPAPVAPNQPSTTPSAAEKSPAATANEKLTNSHTHDLLPKDAPPKPAAETTTPKVAEPPKVETKSAPAPLLDNLTIEGAQEDVVQDVVKILNGLITVINADGAAGKYSSAISKAKEDLGRVVKDIVAVRETERHTAEEKIRNLNLEFDNAAKELIRRFEEQVANQESQWKEEYETEREKLSQAYQNKIQSELASAEKVYDQRLKNELLEQNISLTRQFASTIRDHVEKERNGRLAKLNELSEGVQELERLTAEWNSVLDANLQTQHLVVAIETVKATLENADRPKPFVEELVALKEIAADDALVNAAIASINPTAYQRGIPTSTQLIDRFRRVASEVRKAALLPENAGVASHIASLAVSKFMFKKQGLPVGDDVESVLARTEILLEEGNLDQAAREMNALSGWAKMLSQDWLSEVRRVLEVRQALDVISTEARLQSLLVD